LRFAKLYANLKLKENCMDNSSDFDTNLCGMSHTDAKEYILNFISTLKLTEKQILGLDDEITKWQSRIALANSKCNPELAQDAEKEKQKLLEKQIKLSAEAEGLKQQIDEMRRRLPLLASRERSIDPDLLEQELLMAARFFGNAGHQPGDEEKVLIERQFKELEGSSETQSADAALEELKAKMRALSETQG